MPERTDQHAAQPSPQQCGSCGGEGGRTVDTSSGGVTRQHWERCTSCSGSGVQGGGI